MALLPPVDAWAMHPLRLEPSSPGNDLGWFVLQLKINLLADYPLLQGNQPTTNLEGCLLCLACVGSSREV